MSPLVNAVQTASPSPPNWITVCLAVDGRLQMKRETEAQARRGTSKQDHGCPNPHPHSSPPKWFLYVNLDQSCFWPILTHISEHRRNTRALLPQTINYPELNELHIILNKHKLSRSQLEDVALYMLGALFHRGDFVLCTILPSRIK